MSKSRSVSKSARGGDRVPALTIQARARKRAQATSPKPGVKASKHVPIPKPSKSDQILKLLRRKNGASIGDLQEATDWQAHSVRGFLSGTVKKRLGLTLQSQRTEQGERRYLIAGS